MSVFGLTLEPLVKLGKGPDEVPWGHKFCLVTCQTGFVLGLVEFLPKHIMLGWGLHHPSQARQEVH